MSARWNVFTNNFDLVNALDAVVVGPAISTDNAVARFDGTTGKLLQNSGTTISDADLLSTGEINLTTQLAVPYGGTDRVSATAYAVICGGTTATSAQQSIASVGTATQVLTSNGPGLLPTFEDASGGAPPSKVYWFAAEALQPLETNFAALIKLSGATVKVFVRAFDASTEEYVNSKLQVPSDIDTTGTVTFTSYVMAATAVASKNIALTFGHVAINDSQDFDVSYTDVNSGDKAIDDTQDNVTKVTWTATVATLGWAADDEVIFRVSRPDASVDDLAGDMYMFSFTVSIPRSS